MEENDFTMSIENEIFDNSLDLSTDYAEIALDIFLKDNFLKEIPFVKTLISFYNISSSIVARHNVKKILVFFQEFHSQKIKMEKLEKFKIKFENDIKYKNETLEIILVLIEKFIHIEQSKVLANLLLAHIEDNLTWEEFQKLSFILNTLNPSGYKCLEISVTNDHMKMIEKIEGEAFLLACGIGTTFEDRFRLTNTGKKLYLFGFKPLKRYSI